MEIIKAFYEKQGETLIKALKRRQMEGYYFTDKETASAFILGLIKENSVVTYGGSQTLNEIGIKEKLRKGPYTLLDRDYLKSEEEKKALYEKTVSADYYLMSTNAITLDGKLINVDGSGNRLSALMFGPKQVIIAAGMNKVTLDEESAEKRVRNFAAPPNVKRLGLNTPCAETGKCADCVSQDCICCQTVITRFSRIPGRIKVVLIGEVLGY